MTTILRKTPLHARHVELGARMIGFGGWDMPVFYTGIGEEHRAVRARAGLFDVSHMGQLEVVGGGSRAFLQSVLSNDLDRIGDGQAQYTLLTNDRGGIVDDLIAYRLQEDRYLLVVNAANADADREHLLDALRGHDGRDVELHDRSPEYGMLALQGPSTPDVLAPLWSGERGVDELPPFAFARVTVAGVECVAARTGYTGELGVELLCPAAETERLFDAILLQREHGVVPAGLGARDTLRLEVCYPLHGNDISPETNAIEAGLGWVCALEAKDFRGANVLRRTAAAGPSRRLVAFRMVERAIPRAGMALQAGGRAVGVVTSGTLSPSLDQGIGMGYVETAHAAPGSVLVLDVRGRARDAEVVAKPLYKKET